MAASCLTVPATRKPMEEHDTTALRAEAIRLAVWEAECDRDFLRQCVRCWADGLTYEELNDYVNPSEELLSAVGFLHDTPF